MNTLQSAHSPKLAPHRLIGLILRIVAAHGQLLLARTSDTLWYARDELWRRVAKAHDCNRDAIRRTLVDRVVDD